MPIVSATHEVSVAAAAVAAAAAGEWRHHCEALDYELVAFYYLATFFLALVPRLLGVPAGVRSSAVSYEALTVNKVACAPHRSVCALLALIYYTMAASAAIMVRIAGGAYVFNVNAQSLGEYWLLQALLALYFHLFFNCAQRLFGVLTLVAAVIVCAFDAFFFLRVSDVAGTLLFVFLSWPIALLIFSLLIINKNSDKAIQEHTRRLATSTGSTSSSSSSSRNGSSRSSSTGSGNKRQAQNV
jgi:uncharacterized membrane protein YgcG